MFKTIKDILLSGWNLNRGIRLILGIAILFQYFQQPDIFILMIGLMLILQALFNVACCSNGNCKIEPKSTKNIDETTFEEIK